MRVAIVLALTGVMLPGAAAPQQAPPATEVFLIPLSTAGPGDWINISNNPGYDNQPSFLPDSSSILFSSNRDGKQMDIYRYDIAEHNLRQVTNTPESEYSPTITPDGRTFSVVRVEADQSQRLWRFNLDGSNPSVVLDQVKPVGYHAWIDATHLALFILGSGTGASATLQIADTTRGTAEVVATGIGRSVLLRPKTGTVSYITTGQGRMIKEYDPKTRTSRDLIAPLENSQDAAWGPDGMSLLMASGTNVQRATFDSATPSWAPFGSFVTDATNLKRQPVSSITRMAISPNGRWLAFVAEIAAR